MSRPNEPSKDVQPNGGSAGDEQQAFADLIERARSGDPEAVSQLIEPYRKYLLMIANDGLDDAWRAKMGASDIVQETMLKAQQHLPQFHGEEEVEFKAWLAKILTNDIRKTRRHFQTRKRNTQKEINIQDQSAVARGLVDRHLTPGTDAAKQEKQRALQAAMSSLSSEQRQAIEMRSLKGMSFEEIGEALGKSNEAARKFWARSVETLAQRLKQQAPELVSGDFSCEQKDDERPRPSEG